MLKNYLKTILRRANRNRLNTLINLFGLSVSIACCIIILLFVNHQFGYDQFHTDVEKIYRIKTHETEEGITRNFASSSLSFTPLLDAHLPAAKETVRMLPHSVSVSYMEKDKVFQEPQFFYVDSNFLEVFSFPLVQGNRKTALSDPYSILITQSMADKYFGSENAVGKVLTIEKEHVFTVSGILQDIPSQSSIQLDFVVPMEAAEYIWGDWLGDIHKTWHYPPVYSFVKFNSDINAGETAEALRKIEAEHIPEYIAESRSHSLESLSDIHFSNLENELHPTINKNVLYLFVGIGIIILFIAAFNFINLFLAKIVLHLKSVGIQKVMGANNRNVWRQLLTESLLYLFVSLLLAFVWAAIFLPVFNSRMETEITLSAVFDNGVVLYLFALLVLIGLSISVVPLFFIARFKPIAFLKGKGGSIFAQNKTSSTQSTLVVLQFIVAVTLIISTVIIQSQMHYIKTKNLGLQKSQTLVVPVFDETIQNRFESVKAQLTAIRGVNEVSAISNFPWEKGFYDFETLITNQGVETKANSKALLVDNNIIPALGMSVIEGRGFSSTHGTDSTMAFIMNETAARKFDVQNLQDVKLTMQSITSSEPKEGNLIGIVKDFHLQSLHEEIEPLILTISPRSYFIDNIIIQMLGSDIPQVIQQVEAELKAFTPDRPFEYFFLDQAFEKLYKKELLIGSLFNYFSIIAIIIACLGLLGMVAFATSQRLKEIGIRKVLGSSVMGIVNLLTFSFIKLILLAIGIAVPLGWYFMNKWLEGFAYKVTIDWWVYAFSAILTLFIALFAVGWQSFKAATTNPVEVIRNE
ncbi:ABC transporter permease [Flagellimonas sp.]|uniref:ABC transporter permease n=1 Tax=Flagellimonas sp. TaxID=2058762 RepID=UPI003F4A7690